MVTVSRALAASSIAGSLMAVFAWQEATQAAEGSARLENRSATVVVELFTSQGCSSCPPADRLLTLLGSAPELSTTVFPLAFHVDYWNHIGWVDPFSSHEWSQRQRRYAGSLSRGRVYTPQLVINGSAESVGSNEEKVRRLIGEALQRPPPARLEVRLSAGGPAVLRAEITAEMLEAPESGGGGQLELLVALYEKNLVTPVPSGENRGRTLENDYVVRLLEHAGTLAARPGASTTVTVDLPLQQGWKRTDLGVVAFVQDPRTLAIHGAARATLEIIQ